MVEIRDLASEFLPMVLDASDRREAWKRYEDAHQDIFDVYFGNPYWGRRRDLDDALTKWIEVESRIRRLAAVASAEAQRVINVTAELLRAADVDARFVLFVGVFGANGFQDRVNDLPTVFLALEQIPEVDVLTLLAAHELTHAFHTGLRGGTWADDDPVLAVFSEGLAVYVSERMVPGLPLDDYLWMRSPRTVRSTHYDIASHEGLTELLNASNAKTYERFFNYDPSAPPHGLPPRLGYHLGYGAVSQLAANHPLPQLARWSSQRASEEVRAVLLDSAARGQELRNQASPADAH